MGGRRCPLDRTKDLIPAHLRKDRRKDLLGSSQEDRLRPVILREIQDHDIIKAVPDLPLLCVTILIALNLLPVYLANLCISRRQARTNLRITLGHLRITLCLERRRKVEWFPSVMMIDLCL